MQGNHVIQVILVHATKTATVKNHPYLTKIILTE